MSHDLGLLDITKNSSHLVDHIPNGWVMFNGDMTNDPCINHPPFENLEFEPYP